MLQTELQFGRAGSWGGVGVGGQGPRKHVQKEMLGVGVVTGFLITVMNYSFK